jgi:hypothetical protein
MLIMNAHVWLAGTNSFSLAFGQTLLGTFCMAYEEDSLPIFL